MDMMDSLLRETAATVPPTLSPAVPAMSSSSKGTSYECAKRGDYQTECPMGQITIQNLPEQ
jgi:hypothetical protein